LPTPDTLCQNFTKLSELNAMTSRQRFFLLFCLLTCLTSHGAAAEDRFGLLSVVDGSFTRAQLPPAAPQGSDARLNGQAVLLASYRVTSNLFAFYEGRISHVEGLNDGNMTLRRTYSNAVVQGYLRYTTRLPSGLNLQIGKFGHPFGQFLTRNYPDQNPLISFPLMYTHRTTIRANQIPYNPYDVIRWQSRGGSTPGYYADGSSLNGWLPLINYSYPTGIMAFGNFAKTDYRFALVNSSLANPLNLGTPGQRPQWVAGGGVTPVQRVRVGASFAAGPYLDASLRPYLPAGTRWNDFTQRALGMDLQLTLPHLELQGELLFANFRVPNIPQRLGSTAYFLELKHTLTPRLFVAGRWNQLYFDRFRSGFGNGTAPRFDNNTNSLELGFGFRLSERLLAKSSYQFRRTAVAQDPSDNVFAAQLVYSFDVRKLMRIP
jgi:hypothetical protein